MANYVHNHRFLTVIIELIIDLELRALNMLELNPFAPEPPVTTRADSRPFYPLWRHQFLTVEDNFAR